MKIAYRNGVPTKKSLQAIIDKFDERFWRLNFHTLYGDPNYNMHCLIWQDKYVQSRMGEFIDFATAHGVLFGEYHPYKSPTVGHLHIKPIKK